MTSVQTLSDTVHSYEKSPRNHSELSLEDGRNKQLMWFFKIRLITSTIHPLQVQLYQPFGIGNFLVA